MHNVHATLLFRITSVSGKARNVGLRYQNRGLLLQRCAVTLIVYATVFFWFGIYLQYNIADITMLGESTRSLKGFVPLAFLFLPLLTPQMQEKTDKPALCRNKMICFLSFFLSRWREFGSAQCILPARQVQPDTAISVRLLVLFSFVPLLRCCVSALGRSVLWIFLSLGCEV